MALIPTVTKLGLTRDQLATFLKDHQQIRAFEKLFSTVSDTDGGDSALETKTLIAAAQATANEAANTNHIATDYLDFSLNPPHTDKRGRVVWNSVDDTLNLHHSAGVVQQVGQEQYVRVQNQTGAILANGTVVGYSGVGSFSDPLAAKFLAGGIGKSRPEDILGVMTQDLADSGEVGFCTSYGRVRGINTTGSLVGETWVTGDILYASPTIAGAITNNKPTAPAHVIQIGFVLSVSATQGEIFVRLTFSQDKFYGQFFTNATLTAASINTAYALPIVNTYVANGVTIGTPNSRLIFGQSGYYSISVVYHLISTSANQKTAWLWFRKNGVDIPSSSVIASNSGNANFSVVSRVDTYSFEENDYLELYWAVDDVSLTMSGSAATAFAPTSPALTISVNQLQL
jgi:hypothetical protein